MTEHISLQLQALGAAKPIDCTVNPDCDMNLMSLGRMVIDEGFSFYWTHGGQPHLVTPSGEHIWLEVERRCPVLSTQELVANKINEIQAYAMLDAATSHNEHSSGVLIIPGRGLGPGFRLVPRSNPTKMAM